MIPKRIIQIWLGRNMMPKKWMETWERLNPEFIYHVFDYNAIKMFGLKNDALFEEFIKTKEYHGACDVARIEILERLGGIYIDADSICVKTLENAPFMKADFFAAYDHETKGWPGRINNAIIGSVEKHLILKNYIAKMGQAKEIRPPWRTIGGSMLTECVKEFGGLPINVQILPAYTFWPENHNGLRTRIEGECYAHHFWGTSKKLY